MPQFAVKLPSRVRIHKGKLLARVLKLLGISLVIMLMGGMSVANVGYATIIANCDTNYQHVTGKVVDASGALLKGYILQISDLDASKFMMEFTSESDGSLTPVPSPNQLQNLRWTHNYSFKLIDFNHNPHHFKLKDYTPINNVAFFVEGTDSTTANPIYIINPNLQSGICDPVITSGKAPSTNHSINLQLLDAPAVTPEQPANPAPTPAVGSDADCPATSMQLSITDANKDPKYGYTVNIQSGSNSVQQFSYAGNGLITNIPMPKLTDLPGSSIWVTDDHANVIPVLFEGQEDNIQSNTSIIFYNPKNPDNHSTFGSMDFCETGTFFDKSQKQIKMSLVLPTLTPKVIINNKDDEAIPGTIRVFDDPNKLPIATGNTGDDAQPLYIFKNAPLYYADFWSEGSNYPLTQSADSTKFDNGSFANCLSTCRITKDELTKLSAPNHTMKLQLDTTVPLSLIQLSVNVSSSDKKLASTITGQVMVLAGTQPVAKGTLTPATENAPTSTKLNPFNINTNSSNSYIVQIATSPDQTNGNCYQITNINIKNVDQSQAAPFVIKSSAELFAANNTTIGITVDPNVRKACLPVDSVTIFATPAPGGAGGLGGTGPGGTSFPAGTTSCDAGGCSAGEAVTACVIVTNNLSTPVIFWVDKSWASCMEGCGDYGGGGPSKCGGLSACGNVKNTGKTQLVWDHKLQTLKGKTSAQFDITAYTQGLKCGSADPNVSVEKKLGLTFSNCGTPGSSAIADNHTEYSLAWAYTDSGKNNDCTVACNTAEKSCGGPAAPPDAFGISSCVQPAGRGAPRIAVIGDSLSSDGSWATNTDLQLGLNIVTFAEKSAQTLNGSTIRSIMTQLTDEVSNQEYDDVVILGGINDFTSLNATSQNVIDNLTAIYRKAREKDPNIRIVALTIPPWSCDTPQTAKNVEEVNAWIKSLVSPLVDMVVDTNAIIANNLATNQYPDCHPTAAGYKAMANEVMAKAFQGEMGQSGGRVCAPANSTVPGTMNNTVCFYAAKANIGGQGIASKLVLFGDSITADHQNNETWPTPLIAAAKLTGGASAITNLAVGGSGTSTETVAKGPKPNDNCDTAIPGMIQQFTDYAKTTNTDTDAVFFGGINTINNINCYGASNITEAIARAESDLTKLYQSAKAKKLRVIAVSVLPCNGCNYPAAIPVLNEWIARQALTTPPLVDVYVNAYTYLLGHPEYFDIDGLHPNVKGAFVIAKLMQIALQSNAPEIMKGGSICYQSDTTAAAAGSSASSGGSSHGAANISGKITGLTKAQIDNISASAAGLPVSPDGYGVQLFPSHQIAFNAWHLPTSTILTVASQPPASNWATIGQLPPTTSITKKVMVIAYNPMLASKQTLSSYFQTSSTAMTQEFTSWLRQVTDQSVKYLVSGAVVDSSAFPPTAAGTGYTSTTYSACLADITACSNNRDKTSSFDQCVQTANHCQAATTANVDFAKIAADNQVCAAIAATDVATHVDDIWIFGGPNFGFTDASHAPAITCNGKTIPILTFNYQDGVAGMIYNYGQRATATLNQVFGTPPSNATSAWAQFTQTSSAAKGCGSMITPPNTLTANDNANATLVDSYCESFNDYPTVNPAATDKINCTAWNCTNYASQSGGGFYSYWFKHLPHATGQNNSTSNNWWQYITDPSTYAPAAAYLPYPHVLLSNFSAATPALPSSLLNSLIQPAFASSAQVNGGYDSSWGISTDGGIFLQPTNTQSIVLDIQQKKSPLVGMDFDYRYLTAAKTGSPIDFQVLLIANHQSYLLYTPNTNPVTDGTPWTSALTTTGTTAANFGNDGHLDLSRFEGQDITIRFAAKFPAGTYASNTGAQSDALFLRHIVLHSSNTNTGIGYRYPSGAGGTSVISLWDTDFVSTYLSDDPTKTDNSAKSTALVPMSPYNGKQDPANPAAGVHHGQASFYRSLYVGDFTRSSVWALTPDTPSSPTYVDFDYTQNGGSNLDSISFLAGNGTTTSTSVKVLALIADPFGQIDAQNPMVLWSQANIDAWESNEIDLTPLKGKKFILRLQAESQATSPAPAYFANVLIEHDNNTAIVASALPAVSVFVFVLPAILGTLCIGTGVAILTVRKKKKIV